MQRCNGIGMDINLWGNTHRAEQDGYLGGG